MFIYNIVARDTVDELVLKRVETKREVRDLPARSHEGERYQMTCETKHGSKGISSTRQTAHGPRSDPHAMEQLARNADVRREQVRAPQLAQGRSRVSPVGRCLPRHLFAYMAAWDTDPRQGYRTPPCNVLPHVHPGPGDYRADRRPIWTNRAAI